MYHTHDYQLHMRRHVHVPYIHTWIETGTQVPMTSVGKRTVCSTHVHSPASMRTSSHVPVTTRPCLEKSLKERAPVMHTARVVIKPPGQASSGDRMVLNVTQCVMRCNSRFAVYMRIACLPSYGRITQTHSCTPRGPVL